MTPLELILSATVAAVPSTNITRTKMVHWLHEFKFSIGRNEADAVFRLKLAQLHALMKLTVVNGDRRLTRPTQHRHDNDINNIVNSITHITQPFYSHYTGRRILLEWSFAAHMPLLTATSTIGLGRRMVSVSVVHTINMIINNEQIIVMLNKILQGHFV